MIYNPALEKFIDFVDFKASDPCTFITYPAGAAGDLLATIILKHFCKPAGEFFGIKDNGQVIFRDSDYKQFNFNKYICNALMLERVNTHLSDKNCNFSNVDQIIFSNHGYEQKSISHILNFFKNAQIIRVIPKTSNENNIVSWLSDYKNKNIIKDFENINDVYNPAIINDDRVLTLWFGDIINETRFEHAYDKIIEHLHLPYKLIRHDFIKFWLSKQHPIIRPHLEKL